MYGLWSRIALWESDEWDRGRASGLKDGWLEAGLCDATMAFQINNISTSSLISSSHTLSHSSTKAVISPPYLPQIQRSLQKDTYPHPPISRILSVSSTMVVCGRGSWSSWLWPWFSLQLLNTCFLISSASALHWLIRYASNSVIWISNIYTMWSTKIWLKRKLCFMDAD